MRVSVVLLLFGLTQFQLQESDGQLTVEEEEAGLSRLQTKTHGGGSEVLEDQATMQCNVWTELRKLRDMVVEQKVKLQQSQSQIEELKKKNAELAGRVTSTELGVVSTELGVNALRGEIANTPKVAFSFASGVSGVLGPFNADTMLIFRREITNFGNAYSPITGVFTAPVRGVYFFRLNIFGFTDPSGIAGDLYKNQEKIFHLSDFPEAKHEYASNAASLLLEKGDLVYVKLIRDRHVFDNTDNHCTFNGFLLFPM